MTKNVRVTLVVLAVAAALITLLVALTRPSTPVPDFDEQSQEGPVEVIAPVDPTLLVRDDSHRLSDAPEGAPVLVEFLDFECEACRAVWPTVEQLREEYGDRVQFVARYFPVPSHANAENAAVAVEAAAQQGYFEHMYELMFQTQARWGEQQTSQAAVFRSLAESLALDMDAYDRAVADPATLERVRSDLQDGLAVGVQGTPTFFLDDQRLDLRNADDLRAALDQALTS